MIGFTPDEESYYDKRVAYCGFSSIDSISVRISRGYITSSDPWVISLENY